MKNLENYGVQELNAREIQETDGGGWLSDTFGAAVDAATSFVGGVISYALDIPMSPFPPQGCVGN